jgi:hypothetical protein
VGVALRAEAKHGQRLVLEHIQVGIVVRKYFCRHGMFVG